MVWWCVHACVCVMVRGHDIGLGDPADFYIFSIFSLNGIMAGVIFLLGAFLRCD